MVPGKARKASSTFLTFNGSGVKISEGSSPVPRSRSMSACFPPCWYCKCRFTKLIRPTDKFLLCERHVVWLWQWVPTTLRAGPGSISMNSMASASNSCTNRLSATIYVRAAYSARARRKPQSKYSRWLTPARLAIEPRSATVNPLLMHSFAENSSTSTAHCLS